MANPYIMKKRVSTLNDLKGGAAAFGMGVGNIYYVVKRTEAFYEQIVAEYSVDYVDGSNSICPDVGTATAVAATALLNTGIQDALDKTVECRNDYVVVWPSDADYDIGTALTLTKKGVHLVCPAGMNSYTIGANNAVRIHQLGAYPLMVVSDSAIEIAGFYLKNIYSKGGIIIANSSYGLNIHNNYFAMALDSATNEPMIGPYIANTTGDAGAWSTIERNFIQSQSGGSATIAAIIRTNAQATGTRICNNVIQIGDTNNIATVGIQNLSTKGIVSDNDFYAAQTSSGAGVFTHCVEVSSDGGSAFGNRGNVADSIIVTGGTDEKAFVLNYNSVAGGTIDEL